MSLQKIRDFIREIKGKDYISQKMTAYFSGKDSVVRGIVDKLFSAPLDCMEYIKSGTDFYFQFFLYLHNLIKLTANEEIDGDGLSNPKKLSVFQSIGALLAFVNYYRAETMAQNDKTMAFSEAYERLSDPPYYFTRSQFVRFTNKSGIPILQGYKDEDVDTFLQGRLKSGAETELPDLLIFKGPDAENWYVKKDKVMSLVAKLLSEARPQVKSAITHRWEALVKAYRSDPSMQNDREFENFVLEICNQVNSALLPIVRDSKVMLLQAEEGRSRGGDVPQYFVGSDPVPMRTLLLLRRQEILNGIKLTLPFWYSVPFLVSIIRFFKYGPGANRKKVPLKTSNSSGTEKKLATGGSENSLKSTALVVAQQLIPSGKSIPNMLTAYEDRWNMLLDPEARGRLVSDVNKTVRDHMRFVAKIQSLKSIDKKTLDEIADRIIASNPALNRISDKASLKSYIRLYILQMILKT
jgi:hypothetical protein